MSSCQPPPPDSSCSCAPPARSASAACRRLLPPAAAAEATRSRLRSQGRGSHCRCRCGHDPAAYTKSFVTKSCVIIVGSYDDVCASWALAHIAACAVWCSVGQQAICHSMSTDAGRATCAGLIEKWLRTHQEVDLLGDAAAVLPVQALRNGRDNIRKQTLERRHSAPPRAGSGSQEVCSSSGCNAQRCFCHLEGFVGLQTACRQALMRRGNKLHEKEILIGIWPET